MLLYDKACNKATTPRACCRPINSQPVEMVEFAVGCLKMQDLNLTDMKLVDKIYNV